MLGDVGGTQDGRGIGVDDDGYVYVGGRSQLTWGVPVNPGTNDGASEVLVAKLFADTQTADTEPPVLNIPEDMTVNTDTGGCTATVTFNATATDDVDGDVPVVCDPESGSPFPIGETTVNCSATDEAGNEATGSFTITVEDNETPVITCPEDMTVSADSESCTASVEFTVTATDNCDTDVSVVSDTPSGSSFPIGLTTVN